MVVAQGSLNKLGVYSGLCVRVGPALDHCLGHVVGWLTLSCNQLSVHFITLISWQPQRLIPHLVSLLIFPLHRLASLTLDARKCDTILIHSLWSRREELTASAII